MNSLPKRKPTRIKDYDYNSSGAYFLTICTQNRQCILSHVVGTGLPDCPSVQFAPHGEIADKIINQLNDFYEDISVDRYVIMPNHIHLLLLVRQGGPSRTPVPTRQNSVVSRFVSTFKRFCNKEYGENIWQSRFNDHVIRNREDYEAHLRYIHENPTRWYYDELYTDDSP